MEAHEHAHESIVEQPHTAQTQRACFGFRYQKHNPQTKNRGSLIVTTTASAPGRCPCPGLFCFCLFGLKLGGL